MKLEELEKLQNTPLKKKQILFLLWQRETQLILNLNQAQEPQEQEVIEAHLNEIEWIINLIKNYSKSDYITSQVNDLFNGLL